MSTRSEGVEEMADAYLDCRDKGHHWSRLTDRITDGTKTRVREITRVWQCKGCLTEQEEVIEIPSCEIVRRRYHYPDGYLLAPGIAAEKGRVNVRDIRREVFGRAGIRF